MAQGCHHRGTGLNNLAQSQPADNENGEEPFADIPYQGQDAGLFPGRARNIRGPHVAAPGLLNSDPLSPCDQRASWNGATQIGSNAGEEQNAQVEI